MNLYLVYDKISCRVYDVFMAENDPTAIERNLPHLARFKRLTDFDIYCACKVDVENFETILKNLDGFFGVQEYRLVDKSCYKFTEQEMEYISKTDALRQIEMYRKTQEIQLESLKRELAEARKQGQI